MTLRRVQTILVVDDDDDIRASLRDILEEEGYSVSAAQNGRKAIDMLEAQGAKPDLVLLDLQMPVLNGWQFLRHVRETHLLDDSHVTVLSAMAESHLMPQGVDHLRKPLSLDSLLAAVHLRLDPRRNLREAPRDSQTSPA